MFALLIYIIVDSAAICTGKESHSSTVQSLHSISRLSWKEGTLSVWDEDIESSTSYYSSLWILPAVVAACCVIFIVLMELVSCYVPHQTLGNAHRYEPLNSHRATLSPATAHQNETKFCVICAFALLWFCLLLVCAAILLSSSETSRGLSTTQRGLHEFEDTMTMLSNTAMRAENSTSEIALTIISTQCSTAQADTLQSVETTAGNLIALLGDSGEMTENLADSIHSASHLLVRYVRGRLLLFMVCLAAVVVVYMMVTAIHMICLPQSRLLSSSSGCMKISLFSVMVLSAFVFFTLLVSALFMFRICEHPLPCELCTDISLPDSSQYQISAYTQP